MRIEIIASVPERVGMVVADGVVMEGPEDATDIIGACAEFDVRTVMIRVENLAPGFLDLSTRIAGEVLQKFTQYGFRVAVIGDFSDVGSKSLRDFIRESNGRGQTVFAATPDEALGLFS